MSKKYRVPVINYIIVNCLTLKDKIFSYLGIVLIGKFNTELMVSVTCHKQEFLPTTPFISEN